MYVQGYAETGSAELEVVFNGRTVFMATVPTSTDPAPINRVDLTQSINWQEDINVNGSIGMSCTAHNGDIIIGAIDSNYCGAHVALPTDPQNEPGWVVVVPPVDFWSDPNQNNLSSDGRTNVQLDGAPVLMTRTPSDPGDFTIFIPEGSTLTFDFYIDPSLIVTDLPPWPPQG